jgi:hypothetical protein
MSIGAKPALRDSRSCIIIDMVASVRFLIVVDTDVMGRRWR